MLTIHDMPEEDIRSGKYYDAWHWLWSKEQETEWPSTQKAIQMIEKECELINTVKAKNESRTYRKQ